MYKIVVDSCCEIPVEMKDRACVEYVPLEIMVGDYRVLDDETFNQKELLEKIAASEECPRSSCPSPERYLSAYKSDEADRVYVVTLSSELSGSYNSAMLAKKLYEEENGTRKIHVFDSLSASGGEGQIALKIMDMEEKGDSFEKIVSSGETFRQKLSTFFVLDNLETLQKNGRLSNLKAFIANTLNIKPVLCAKNGKIEQLAQAIGSRKGLVKLVDYVLKIEEIGKKRIVITHCNCIERAEQVYNMIKDKLEHVEIFIIDMAGISTIYANEGGIIITA